MAGPPEAEPARVLLAGVGNPMRRDDAAGLHVVRRLRPRLPPGVRVVECDGDLTRLLDAAAGAQTIVIVDALAAAAASPGDLVRLDPRTGDCLTSTHGIGVAQLAGLLAALGAAPNVRVYGVAGADFGWGDGLSPALAARLAAAADELLTDILTSVLAAIN